MTLDALIMSAGAFIAILPFLGFPDSWDNIFMIVVGTFVVALGIVVRRRGMRAQKKSQSVQPMTPMSFDDGHAH